MRLYYSEQGSGKPMVLLHGNGEDGSYFRHQTAYFAKNYHVFALDTRGHGRSPRGTAPFTLRQFAVDLKQFLDEKKLRDIILLGFSDGGNIALIFTLLYPEYVDQLVINGANLNPFGMKVTVLAGTLGEYAAVNLKLLAGRVSGYFGGGDGPAGRAELTEKKEPARREELTEKAEPARRAELTRKVEPVGRAESTGRTEAAGREGLTRRREFLNLLIREPFIRPEHLRQIRVPTLVIAGTRDMIRESHTRRIHRQIPGSRLRLVRGDHFIAARRPREFNRAVGHFLVSTGKIKK